MIEAQIYTALKNLQGGRVFPMIAPQGTVAPYIVYLLPSDITEKMLEDFGSQRVAVQVDVYAKSLMAAVDGAAEVVVALSVLEPGDIERTPGYEEDTDLYRQTIETVVWL